MGPHSILLIDPFKNLINAYRMILEAEGYVVESAFNLEEAKVSINRDQHSVIIIEYIYPYEATEEFIHKVKESSPEIYILMVANAIIDGETFKRLFTNGVDDFILKPYSADWILVLINKGLKQRELILNLRELKRFHPFHPISHQMNEWIFNRDFFYKTLQKELNRAKRHHYPISLVLIKTSGEEKEPLERFLKELLHLIRKHTRAEDLLSRNNGEITLLLPETDEAGCQSLLKRLYQLLEAYPKFQSDQSLSLFAKNVSFQPLNLPDQLYLLEPLHP